MKKGSTHSSEARAKMSAVRKGRPGNVGSKRTPEQKAKMRAAAAIRWAEAVKTREMKKAARALEPRKKTGPKPKLTPEERVAREKARAACKRMLRRVLKMARIRKDASTEALLGYSKEELRAHLEAQFRPGMSWLDRDSFHIDHIHPVADFFNRGIFDPSIINALSNLQVLTPEENWAKSDRVITITTRGVMAGIHP